MFCQVSSWLVKFDDNLESRRIEDLLMKKDDWPSVKLACGSHINSIPPWCGRGMCNTIYYLLGLSYEY